MTYPRLWKGFLNIIGRDILKKLHATNKGFEKYVQDRVHRELSRDPLMIRSFSHDALHTSEENRIVSEIWTEERRKALAAQACRKRRWRIGTSHSMSSLQQADLLTTMHKNQEVSYVIQRKNRKKKVGAWRVQQQQQHQHQQEKESRRRIRRHHHHQPILTEEDSGSRFSLRERERMVMIKGGKEEGLVEERPWKKNFDHCGKCSFCFPCEPMSYVVEDNYTALNL